MKKKVNSGFRPSIVTEQNQEILEIKLGVVNGNTNEITESSSSIFNSSGSGSSTGLKNAEQVKRIEFGPDITSIDFNLFIKRPLPNVEEIRLANTSAYTLSKATIAEVFPKLKNIYIHRMTPAQGVEIFANNNITLHVLEAYKENYNQVQGYKEIVGDLAEYYSTFYTLIGEELTINLMHAAYSRDNQQAYIANNETLPVKMLEKTKVIKLAHTGEYIFPDTFKAEYLNNVEKIYLTTDFECVHADTFKHLKNLSDIYAPPYMQDFCNAYIEKIQNAKIHVKPGSKGYIKGDEKSVWKNVGEVIEDYQPSGKNMSSQGREKQFEVQGDTLIIEMSESSEYGRQTQFRTLAWSNVDAKNIKTLQIQGEFKTLHQKNYDNLVANIEKVYIVGPFNFIPHDMFANYQKLTDIYIDQEVSYPPLLEFGSKVTLHIPSAMKIDESIWKNVNQVVVD